MTLKDMRQSAGLLQDFVARKMNVSQSAVSRWEAGSAGIARKNRNKLAKLYGVTVDELIQASEEAKG